MSTAVDDDPAPWSGSALVERDGVVLERLASGTTGAGPGRAWSERTRSQASSISKQVVSVVALALVERGDLDLYAPLRRWLAEAPTSWDTMTLHHLLAQTSGIGHWPELGLAPLTGDPPGPDDLIALVRRTPLLGTPGGRWRYSSPGFLVASRVLEAATRSSYAALASELALGPAGLTATTSGVFALEREPAAGGRHDGQPVYVAPGLAALPGTGDLWTTAADLVAWSRALREGRVLRDPTPLWTRHARLPADGTAGPTAADGYGYGTFLGSVRGRPAWYAPGDNPGYQSLLAHLTDDGTTVAVLADDDEHGVSGALAQLAPRRGDAP